MSTDYLQSLVAPQEDVTAGMSAGPGALPDTDENGLPKMPTSLIDSYLERAAGPLSRIQANPRGFAAGLALGAARGLASRGSMVAARRKAFDADQESRAKARTAANIAATADARKQALEDARTAGAATAKDAENQANFERDHPEVTAEDVAATPGLRRFLGKRVPVEWLRPADTRAKPASDQTAAAPAPMGDDDFEIMAKYALKTGGLPPGFSFGMGKQGSVDRANFRKYMQKKYPGADLATNRATYMADKADLQKQQLQLDQFKQFQGTLESNIGILSATINHIPDVGIMPLNGLLRQGALMMGSGSVANFRSALGVVTPEAARILHSGSTVGGAPLSDASRKDLSDMINGNYSKRQFFGDPKHVDPKTKKPDRPGILKILRMDAGNRIDSNQKIVDTIKARLAKNPMSEADTGASPAMLEYDPATGELTPSGGK